MSLTISDISLSWRASSIFLYLLFSSSNWSWYLLYSYFVFSKSVFIDSMSLTSPEIVTLWEFTYSVTALIDVMTPSILSSTSMLSCVRAPIEIWCLSRSDSSYSYLCLKVLTSSSLVASNSFNLAISCLFLKQIFWTSLTCAVLPSLSLFKARLVAVRFSLRLLF